jgi:hypothetical protein
VNPAVPPPLDPHTAKAVNDVIEYGGKAAVSLAAIAAFVRLIAQPVMKWRDTRRTARKKAEAEMIREVLREEIARLDAICKREEQILDEYVKIIARQEQIFRDIDQLVELALDNRERLDEINCLMDELGLTSRDRRLKDEEMQAVLEGLVDRRKHRRRRLPIKEPEQPQ